MNKYEAEIFNELEAAYPDSKIALNFDNDFQLLVAVILSAQCTDERVNKVTPALFSRFPDALAFYNSDIEEVKKLIFSTGFYNNKAKSIKGAAKTVVEKFNGILPSTMEELLTLPGVARKTANVVLCTLFNKSYGVTVDTHVIRLSGRLNLVPSKMSETKNANAIEKILMKIYPKNNWCKLPHLFIFHGRNICTARRPKCSKCVIEKYCPSSLLKDSK
ncbi:endonuclease III [Candidatus Peregrinibacteria bacterium]|nr:endonuclease III [Candidatus Peregrinibacteria bacterium]